MKKTIAIIAVCAIICLSCNNTTPENRQEKATESQGFASVMDSSENTALRNSVIAFANGDMDAFTANMDDNIRFFYPAPGDSLFGRAAVKAYYSERWKVIDSVRLIEDPIFLSVNVHRDFPAMPGKWSMAWYSYKVNYKSGNGILIPIHSIGHMNAAGKFDFLAMYYDMHKVMTGQRK